jgi:HD-GYP domain-containing protein (c-di-GMP phosphodiesterase class II)
MPALLDTGRAHCEVGDRLAQRFGLGEGTRKALFQIFERWNGKGLPFGIKGEAIARAARIANVAQEAEIGHRLGGASGAAALVRRRAGRMLDPSLAERFAKAATAPCARIDGLSLWPVLAAEPGAPRMIDDAVLDEGLRAMADFTDLQSRWFRGHSAGVAALASAAAERLGLSRAEAKLAERAALVHDVGRVGISMSIWNAARALHDREWERVRLHPYITECILWRAAPLAPVGELAALAHERVDGRGYHRRLPPSALAAPARLLAASDAYQAMTEDRPHRAALSPERAADELRGEARAGRLDGEAVEAVLGAAGHRTRARTPRPGSLSDPSRGDPSALARADEQGDRGQAADLDQDRGQSRTARLREDRRDDARRGDHVRDAARPGVKSNETWGIRLMARSLLACHDREAIRTRRNAMTTNTP